jgi:hypothetical protein
LPQHFGTHLDTIKAELPKDVSAYKEWCDALAASLSIEGASGVDEMSGERTPPGHPGNPIFTFNKGNFLDLPLGRSSPDSIRVGTTQEGPGTQSNLDYGEQSMEVDTEVDSPRSSYTWDH